MTWRKWPGANFSPGPWRDVSGHGSSVQPNDFNFIHILLFVFHIITFFVGLQDTKSTAAVVKLFIKFLSCLLFYSLAVTNLLSLLSLPNKISHKKVFLQKCNSLFMSQQKWRTFYQQLCNIMSLNETKQNEPDCLSEAYGSVSECM